MSSPQTSSVTPADSERDAREQCWRLHLRGQSPQTIAAVCQKSIDWVQSSIQQLMQQTEQGAELPPLIRLEMLIAELNQVREAAWKSWEQSLCEKWKSTEKTIVGGPGGGRTEESTSTEERTGEPAYLRLVLECNRREAALRGLGRATRNTHSTGHLPMNMEEMLRRVEAGLQTEDAAPPHHGQEYSTAGTNT